MKKVELKIHKLRKALESLENIYLKPNLEDRSNIDATIQRFEFTFELFWKALKEVFYQNGLELHSPKEIIKEAFNQKLIDSENIWIQMLNDRTLTSHTYDENLADDIFIRIKTYVPIIRKALDSIIKRIE